MKAVILAGGLGTRLSEETVLRPKPMVEVGGRPMLWHIMKLYSHYGINDFVVCLGYRGYVIKEYFANYFLHMADVTFDLAKNSVEIHEATAEPWRVTLVDTGLQSMTGGRIKRIKSYVEGERFLLTYGDGVGNIDIRQSLEFHEQHGRLATVTVTQPPGRFGRLQLDGAAVTNFAEKPQGEGGWINGGFFVLEPGIFDYIDGDESSWELEPLQRLTAASELRAYRHDGFWLAMDTLRDKNMLEGLWSSGNAPWKVW